MCFMLIDALLGISGLVSLSALYQLGVFIPCLAVGCRRLHDIGKSGWWWLFGLIPVIGLLLLCDWCHDTSPGENRFGPNPKGL